MWTQCVMKWCGHWGHIHWTVQDASYVSWKQTHMNEEASRTERTKIVGWTIEKGYIQNLFVVCIVGVIASYSGVNVSNLYQCLQRFISLSSCYKLRYIFLPRYIRLLYNFYLGFELIVGDVHKRHYIE